MHHESVVACAFKLNGGWKRWGTGRREQRAQMLALLLQIQPSLLASPVAVIEGMIQALQGNQLEKLPHDL